MSERRLPNSLQDLLPLAGFLLTYYLADLYAATAVLMGMFSLMALWHLIRYRRLSAKLGWTTALVVVLGGLTLWLRNPLFIMWKPTLVCSALAITMLVSQWLGKRNVVQLLLDRAITLNDTQWRQLNTAGAIQLLGCAALNLYVAYSFSEAIWVNFKVFGLLGINIAFAVGVGLWLSRQQAADTT